TSCSRTTSGASSAISAAARRTVRRLARLPASAAVAAGRKCLTLRVSTRMSVLLVRGLLERQRHRVHAVAVPGGGLRGVVEDVPEVGVAAGAPHLGADHPVRAVLD